MNELQKKANLVRAWCIRATTESASGHPTSCMSAADIATVLFNDFFTYDLENPHNPHSDRIVFSKGHAAPLLYTLFALSGAFDPKKLLTLRKINSSLEGHPTSEFKYTEAATGSLGQGLSVGAGIAYGSKKDAIKNNTYVLLGDGELAEGSVWEAANFASYYKLNNLIAIADINRFGQSQETMFGHDMEQYVGRFSAFGWEVLLIDGHNFEEIEKAFKLAVNNTGEKPFVIIAKTKKGKGVSFLEDKDNWHGKPVKKEDLKKAEKELGEIDESLRFKLRTPQRSRADVASKNFLGPAIRLSSGENFASSSRVQYKIGDKIATREVYGKVLAELGNTNPFIYALDGDTKNSTFSQDFLKVHPDRFIECFIAEQNMVGVALGLSRLGKKPFVSTFSAFLTRAFDQIRMSTLSKANITFVGSHCGVSIGEDGSSQMGLEDIAMFGALADSVILHPSDAVSTVKLLPHLVQHAGISYLRTLRPKTPVLYDSKEKFLIGGSKVLRSSKKDVLTIVAAGITVHEALKAYEKLKEQGILVRVVDCYSVKPIDKKTLTNSLKETKKKIVITVEDHYEHGGLGDFVLSALSDSDAKIYKMAVNRIPHSGTKDELLDYVGISAKHIVRKITSLIKSNN